LDFSTKDIFISLNSLWYNTKNKNSRLYMKKLSLLLILSTYLFSAGYTELMRASIRGDLNGVKKLVASGVNLDEKYIPMQNPKKPAKAPAKPTDDNRGSTALMFAIKHSNIEIAKYLIEHDANIHLRNRNGATLLMQSVYYNYPEVAKLLIEYGADLNAVSKNGISVLIVAIDRNMSDEFLDYLIRNGANIEYRTQKGWTPLHFAVYKKLPASIIKKFINHGANVDARTDKGWTPLTLAVKNRLPIQSIEAIAQKADLYSKTAQGMSAIKIARDNNYKEIIPILSKILKDKSKLE
jgi:ankyrin repeat protein